MTITRKSERTENRYCGECRQTTPHEVKGFVNFRCLRCNTQKLKVARPTVMTMAQG